jgi:hypothetical protein
MLWGRPLVDHLQQEAIARILAARSELVYTFVNYCITLLQGMIMREILPLYKLIQVSLCHSNVV